MAIDTQMVLEAKKNKLNNSSKWFTFGQKNQTVVSSCGLFAYIFYFKNIFLLKIKTINLKYITDEEKEIYIVDLDPFRDIQWLLSNATKNINQIAKATNITGVIYKNEIESMNKQIEKLSKEIWQIHSLLINKSKES